MNKILTLLFLLIVFGACKKLPVPKDEFVDPQKYFDNMAVTSVTYENKIGNNLYFDLNVVAMKNTVLDFYYPDSAFKEVSQNGITISVESVLKNTYSNNDNFQTIVLIDQTKEEFKSYFGIDINHGLNRLNKLCKKNENQDFGIGYFARDEVNGESPVYYFKNANTQSLFEHTEQEMMGFITQNYLYLGKAVNSNLYDAINDAVDKLIASTATTNKSVTVIFSNLDDGASAITNLQLIQKCLDNNIKINLISYLNFNFNNIRMASQTGGFVSQVASISTAVYHIHDLLANNKKEYTLKCRATRAANWTSNSFLWFYVHANYFQEINGIYFEEDLYDDLDIDQYLPFYLKIL
jgi:hypothetical protein